MDTAVRLDVPARSTIYRDDEPPRIGLVVSGLLRGYVVAPDGRQVTVRYDRPGDVIGMMMVTAGPMDASVQAPAPTTMLMLDARTYRRIASHDPLLAWLTAREVGAIAAEMLEEFRCAHAPVRQRIARHIHALGEASGWAGEIHLTQQELADVVGSAREVVTRALRALRAAGVVETFRDGVSVLDWSRLTEEARPPERARHRGAARSTRRGGPGG